MSFLSTGDAFLYCGINQPADTRRVINLFAAAYGMLTHKHRLNESHSEIDRHGKLTCTWRANAWASIKVSHVHCICH